MKIDVYTFTGTKKGSLDLPAALFEAPVREGLLHQAVIRQQSNRRRPIAHAKGRSEVQGSTHKLFAQKGTGRARRGSVRSPLLRGGGKAFGPRKNMNFMKDMPRKMRRAALASSLSLQAEKGTIIGLENYPDTIKTKDALLLLKKLPVDIGRRILFVLPEANKGLTLSVRNIPCVETTLAQYLNPETVLRARHIVFLVDAVKKAEELFGMDGDKKAVERKPKSPKKPTKPKKEDSSESSVSSVSSDSSKKKSSTTTKPKK